MARRALRGAAVPPLVPRAVARLFRPVVLSLLRRLRRGRITLVDGGERFDFGPPGRADMLAAIITVHDPRFYSSVASGALIGAGEAYARGDFSVDDLVTLARLVAHDRELLDAADAPILGVGVPLHRLRHLLRRGSRAGSRRNVAAHYDLGDDFFALFLDETMTYSCGVFDHAGASLAQASAAKNERVCRKLRLAPGDRLIEIGSGWGGFALHAARHHGCHVTTTTISERQYEHAKRRVAAAGLSGKVTVLLRDYRDLDGRFDKLASIEMIEAVGDGHLDEYFAVCSRLLTPSGLACIQAITAPDQGYERYRRSIGFTQLHIFPGSLLPSVATMSGAAARSTDLAVLHLEDIGAHYAPTLRAWRERLLASASRARELGFDEGFLRTWEFYFATCEAAFAERSIGDVQMVLAKPAFRDALAPAPAPRGAAAHAG
jgi:cyclopropane-fatty-acyl-phospholipid synthase